MNKFIYLFQLGKILLSNSTAPLIKFQAADFK